MLLGLTPLRSDEVLFTEADGAASASFAPSWPRWGGPS